MAKNKFYGVKVGMVIGVYDSWEACQENVKGVPGAIFKGFPTKEEAIAFVYETPLVEEKTPVLAGVSVNDSVQAAMDLFGDAPPKRGMRLEEIQNSVPWTPEVVMTVFTPREIAEFPESRIQARVWHTNKLFELMGLLEHYFSYELTKEGNADGYLLKLFNGFGIGSPEFHGSAGELLDTIRGLDPISFK